MRKLIYIIVFISISMVLNAQGVKKINSIKPGTLSTLLTKTDQTTLTNLTLSGLIDARDFATMRDLLKLEYLDLSGAKILAHKGRGGTTYSDNDTVVYNEDEIPEMAFSNFALRKTNKSLKELILPNSLTSIGLLGVMACEALVSVKCPKSLKKISDMAFQDCYSLTQFEIGENVNYIGSQAFHSCTNIKKIIFNNSYADGLDGTTFYYCPSLKSIYINTSTPPKFNLEKGVFESLITDKSNITIFVKPGTLELFKQDANWNVFPNIMEL